MIQKTKDFLFNEKKNDEVAWFGVLFH